MSICVFEVKYVKCSSKRTMFPAKFCNKLRARCECYAQRVVLHAVWLRELLYVVKAYSSDSSIACPYCNDANG